MAVASASSKPILWWLLAGTVAVLGVAVAVALLSEATATGARDAAATLALASAVAVGIERLIETFWTIVGFFRGGWWPINIVGTKIEEMVSDLDGVLKPVYADADAAIQKLVVAGSWTQQQATAASDEITKIQDSITDLKGLARDDQRVQLIGSAALQGINVLQQKYPEITKSVKVATEAIGGLTNFVGTFKDNPGRRLISLYLGMLIGLVVAGVLGLDLFQAFLVGGATLASTAPAGATESEAARIGVAATGIVLGLGANPTHELIKLLQETKKGRAANNVPEVQSPPTIPTELVQMDTIPAPEGEATGRELRSRGAGAGVAPVAPPSARWKLTRD